jgi:hypothetical protein
MSQDLARLTRLLGAASASTRALVETLLEQDRAGALWGERVGPTLSQAVSKNHSLLRLAQRDGQVGYPAVQFDGRRPLPGLAPVLAALDGALRPLTGAGWLTLASPDLDGRCPVEALRDREADGVLALARQVARAAACCR